MRDDDRDSPPAGLPASILAAWGRTVRTRKGPRPGLTLERIVGAAVTVAARDGLAAVSMSRVAAQLGAGPMSLYRYVDAKDELLALMVDAAGGTPPPRPEGEVDWRAGLTRWAWSYHDVLLRHPWILRIPIKGPPATPNQVAWLDDGLQSLEGTPLTAQEKMSVILLLSGFVRNAATLSTEIMAAITAGGPDAAALMSSYGQLLSRLIEPGRFPALQRVIESGALDDDDDEGFTGEFSFGLDRLLDGVAVLVERGSPGR